MKICYLPTDNYTLYRIFHEQRVRVSLSDISLQDKLLFVCDNQLAGVADIFSFEGDQLSINFLHILLPEHRPYLRESISYFQWITQPDSDARLLALTSLPNDFLQVSTSIDELLASSQKEKPSEPFFSFQELKSNLSEHSQAQYLIKQLGFLFQLDVFIASNDQNRMAGERLGQSCLSSLPDYSFSPEYKKRISLIDAIWVKQGVPLCCFEAEITSSIYSGILRMADLMSLLPLSSLRLYIVAPESRREKVRSELARPLFQATELSKQVKFISLENLEQFYEKVKDFSGLIHYDALETIAETFLTFT